LVASQKLRLQRLRAAKHAIGSIAADHQTLLLLNLQSAHAVQRPGQGQVDSRHRARLYNAAKPRHHSLRIRWNNIDRAQQPQNAGADRDALPH
jgi:hypothetical protein